MRMRDPPCGRGPSARAGTRSFWQMGRGGANSAGADDTRLNPGGIDMLLDHNKLEVKSQTKAFSSKKAFEILDGESGQLLGTARDTTGFLPSLFGSTVIEVRDASNDAPLFTVSRTGFLFKKDEVKNPQGEVVGRYKAKMLSLSGGFHVYDKDGKHLAEIQGKMLSAE